MCERIGELGAALVPGDATVVTICNAGVLATGGIGTALAPIYTCTRPAGRRRSSCPRPGPCCRAAGSPRGS